MFRNLLTLSGLIVLIYLSFSLESATQVKPESDTEFSVLSTLPYLQEIAAEPHPMGSTQNKQVRDYIVGILEKEGLEVRVESGYVNHSWKPTFMRMAYVENIIATLKGSNPNGKKVVLAGHYDSVFEGPGAADDGYAVASMIETAKLLKNTNHQNDVELLITDGEEMGLYGARHYAENNDLSNIGIMLNFEARGNAGPGIAFEYSNNNAWLIREMKKVSTRPIANSLSFEVYRRMPNSSDFTIFLRNGVQGINYAFIDGFSYYHNPVDNVENLSLESVQHTGENMYLMAKHFANYDFGEEPKGNASFFNFYGTLINYPSVSDIYILIFALLLLGFTMYTSNGKNDVTIGRILISFLAILSVIILCGLLNFGLAYAVKEIYPQYGTFYSYHYYNHEWYLISGLGLTALVCWVFGSRLLAKYGNQTIGLATAIVISIFTIAIYSFIPTGTYLMLYPLMALTVAMLLHERLGLKENHWQSWALALGMFMVFVGIWTNITHNLFLGFSLGALPGAVIPCALFCFVSMSLLPPLWKKREFLVPIFGLCLFSYAIGNAHIKSKPTVSEPLKSNLFFVQDNESDNRYWASYNSYINEGHLDRLEGAEEGRLPQHLPFSRWVKKSDQRADQYVSEVKQDTLESESIVRVSMKQPKRATYSYIVINEIENLDKLVVDGHVNQDFEPGATGLFYSVLYGVGLDSMTIDFVKKDLSKPTEAYINFSYQEMLEKEELPEGIVRDDGYVYISELVKF